jgi:hypothetical protein
MAYTLVRRSTIELSYPVTSPTITVTLPSPLFENSEKTEVKRIVRRTSGLASKVFRDTLWPDYTVLYYICQACTSTQRANYLSLVSQSYGNIIKLLDYESRTWTGILIPAEITEQHKNCGYVIQFEFQGDLLT